MSEEQGHIVDWRHATTERLALDEPTIDDLDDLFKLHHDPRSWTHLPRRRHLDPDRTRAVIEGAVRRFASDGLSYWSVRLVPGGPVVGWGGCSIPHRHP